jgi:predicted metal-dependent phosphotriesterase family hydrolase
VPESAWVRTVTGPVGADELGVTMGHEHVLLDGWEMFRTYDAILDDEALAIAELVAYRDTGGAALVDCTSVGIGRDPLAVRRISAASRVRIVLGTGWYRRAVYPGYVRTLGVDALSDILVTDLTTGIDGSDVRAGFIGEIGTERHRIAAAEERVFRAAARAQRRTGVSIWTHTTNGGELALEQIELLVAEGVPVARIVVSHIGDRLSFGHLAAVAATGVYLSVDNIGYVGGGYPPDTVRADNVARLLEHGHGQQVMLGGDTCTRSMLGAYGGPGYGRVLTAFLPMLRARGVDDDAIRTMLVDVPARALAVPG